MKPEASDHVSDKDKTADRRVKSVNFTDLELFDYAMGRATNLYGGNFSAYVIALIERDRSLGDSRKLYLDLEHRILDLIRPFGGQPLPQNHSFDFEVPELNLLIEAKSRFPRRATDGVPTPQFASEGFHHRAGGFGSLSSTRQSSLRPRRSVFVSWRQQELKA